MEYSDQYLPPWRLKLRNFLKFLMLLKLILSYVNMITWFYEKWLVFSQQQQQKWVRRVTRGFANFFNVCLKGARLVSFICSCIWSVVICCFVWRKLGSGIEKGKTHSAHTQNHCIHAGDTVQQVPTLQGLTIKLRVGRWEPCPLKANNKEAIISRESESSSRTH